MSDRDSAKVLEELRAIRALLADNRAAIRALLRAAQKKAKPRGADEPGERE